MIEVYADFIYYAIIGDLLPIDNLVSVLNKENIDKCVEYLSLKLIIPLAVHKDTLESERNISIQLDNIIEEAQAYAFSNYSVNDSYMLICLKTIDNNRILTFPRYILIDGNDPEKGLIQEFSRLSNGIIDSSLRNTIKPTAIIGSNRDVVLYVSKLKNKKKYSDDDALNNILQLLESLQTTLI